MAPSPIPAPLPPWARTLLQVAPIISVGLQQVLQYLHEMNHAASPTPDEWRRLQFIFERTGDTLVADRMVSTQDVINITNGTIDNSWTTADHDQVVGGFNAWWNGNKPVVSSNVSHIETRIYRMQFTPPPSLPLPPDYVDKPFVKSGSPVAIYAGQGPGTSASPPLAPQSAISTTEKTPYPRHWGRNYWPGVTVGDLSGSGHWTSTIADDYAASVGNWYALLQQAEFFPVVTVTQIDKVPARALLQVTSIQVDDVPDVIRRRRPRSTTYRATSP